MTERHNALDTLERVRSNHVERARTEVAACVLALERAETLLRECQIAHARAAEALTSAIRAQVALFLPKELLWAERHIRALHVDLETARLRSLRAQAQMEDHRTRLEGARTRLREDEMARRAVANALERERSETALVRLRRQEDENDEVFRGRAG